MQLNCFSKMLTIRSSRGKPQLSMSREEFLEKFGDIDVRNKYSDSIRSGGAKTQFKKPKIISQEEFSRQFGDNSSKNSYSGSYTGSENSMKEYQNMTWHEIKYNDKLMERKRCVAFAFKRDIHRLLESDMFNLGGDVFFSTLSGMEMNTLKESFYSTLRENLISEGVCPNYDIPLETKEQIVRDQIDAHLSRRF